MKKVILSTLSLLLLSGAAMAGGEGASNAREMRARMDAQIAAQQAAVQQDSKQQASTQQDNAGSKS
ncbi:hypothetical protein VI26_16885 [Chromobacterium sp. LK1]|uniref:hypothetical protein n=1 Tax=Chromobacterium sp. LK1 TaxID=1628193 RepID=UPI0006538B0F|nr:hypothetical protein [Chromobacterium sp. LK1]KMN32320.1 hypothetical protein VI26_16885 [Chromobacterium sp. LK1]